MKKQGCYFNHEALEMEVDIAVKSMEPGWGETAAILILANVGATTESCPYKSSKYLPIIGDFHGCRGGSPCPPHLKFLSLQAKMRITGETTVKIDNASGSYYNQIKIKTRR